MDRVNDKWMGETNGEMKRIIDKWTEGWMEGRQIKACCTKK